MKKMISTFVVLFVLCLTQSSFSQIKLGVIGGLNLSNLKFDPEQQGVSWDNRTSFGVGGVLSYDFQGGLGILFEPMYLQKGSKATPQGGEAVFKLAYIELPIMLRYMFETNSEVKPYIMAGPTVGLRMSSKLEITPTGGTSTETDYKDSTKSTDFGVSFGGGILYQLQSASIFVDGRYTLGLTDINNSPNDNTTVKTKGIQIFVGVLFPIK